MKRVQDIFPMGITRTKASESDMNIQSMHYTLFCHSIFFFGCGIVIGLDSVFIYLLSENDANRV